MDRLKIVGNIMELKRPTVRMEIMETMPNVWDEITIMSTAPVAK
jgi:hypothetical protein